MSLRTVRVTREYNTATDVLARLASYALSQPMNIAHELGIEERQDSFAISDLLTISLSVRRLIVATESYEAAKTAVVSVIRGSNNVEISVWELLGIIIHNDILEIMRTENRKYQLTKNKDSHVDSYNFFKENEGKYFSPILYFKSDKTEKMFMGLSIFLEILADDILNKVLEVLEEEGFALSSLHDMG